jgi:hypothetical protein
LIPFSRQVKLAEYILLRDTVGCGDVGDGHPTPDSLNIGDAGFQAGLLEADIGTNRPQPKKANQQETKYDETNRQ